MQDTMSYDYDTPANRIRKVINAVQHDYMSIVLLENIVSGPLLESCKEQLDNDDICVNSKHSYSLLAEKIEKHMGVKKKQCSLFQIET